LQSEAVKKLQAFADKNKETQGKFTIGDEKASNSFRWTWNGFLTRVPSSIMFS
jgi:hydroxyacylglutathione hydrolase